MKKWMILLALAAGMAFAGCSDEESLSEQIADQIQSYGADKATIYSLETGGYKVFKENVDFDIEVPFLVYYETVSTYKNFKEAHYILLDNCNHVYQNPTGGPVHLYFDCSIN